MEREEVTVEMGSHQVIIIDKLFGPHLFANLRITADPDRDAWVIERQWNRSGGWGEWCTIPAQITQEFDYDPHADDL